MPMQNRVDDKYLGMYVLLASVAVCLFVAPFNSIDPVNLPKLCLLVILSFIGAGFAFSKVDFLKSKRNRPVLLSIGLFIALLFLVLVTDSRDFSSKFYGTSGRNTGFVAYLSLSFLFIASVVSASPGLLKKYAVSIVSSGTILAIYGLAQSRGYDFYEFGNAYGTNVFGSFGNPNFQSAFMGITATVSLTLATYSRTKIYFKVGLLSLTFLAIYNISLSSQQGYLNFAAGFAAATVIYLFTSRKQILGWVTLTCSGISGFLVLLGILNIGPLAAKIYESSLLARGFYWRAAAKMLLEHPLFGVGMDGYGDAYLRARTTEIATYNAGISADTAHNIPLDIGSNGGFPLLIAYLSLVFLALISIIRIIKRATSFDVVLTTIVAAWVAYQAQSLISINQIGLGVWGWSLSGLIIGYELSTRTDSQQAHQKVVHRGKSPRTKISALALVLSFTATGIGAAIALPPYLSANKFYKALQSGDANLIEPAAYLKPYDRTRFSYVAQILQENNLDSRAISVLRDATTIYPDSIELWKRWSTIPSAAPADVARAKAEIKRLDPFNPNL